MAKRVAAQRRGFLYGMIASIFVAVILAVVCFWMANENTKVLQMIGFDLNADATKSQAKIKQVQQDLKSRGLGDKVTLTDAVSKLIKQSTDYEQSLSELAVLINSQSPGAELRGESLITFVKNERNTGDKALAEATKALNAPVQSDVEIKVGTPPNLVSAISLMKDHLAALSKAYDRKLGDLATSKTEVETLKTSQATVVASDKANFDKIVQEKTTEIASVTKLLDEAKTTADTFAKEKETAREAALKAQNEAKAEMKKLNGQISQLNTSLDELIQKLRRETVGQFTPDGKIVRLSPGSTTGYINLAKGDGVFANLSFAVYGAAEVGKENAQPKGFITLTNVMDDASEFNIVSQRKNNPIIEGDVIANVVYDRTKRFHFAVVGRFDLNGTGHDDVDMVKKFIERFGGKIDPEINVNTDYLVVGEDPMSSISTTATPSPQETIRINEAIKAQKAMSEATVFAKRLWIPVLNQNRFLTLIGIKPTDLK